MNFSLHLQTIFTFIRQNKATSKGKKQPIRIYKNCTTHLLVIYLNSMTGSVLAERCTGNTVHAHIHIYIYPRPWSFQMLQTHAFLLFHVVTFLFRLISGPNTPTPLALSQPLCSLASGFLGCYVGWGKSMHGQEHVSECLCCVHSYSRATEKVLDDHLNESMEPCWSNT